MIVSSTRKGGFKGKQLRCYPTLYPGVASVAVSDDSSTKNDDCEVKKGIKWDTNDIKHRIFRSEPKGSVIKESPMHKIFPSNALKTLIGLILLTTVSTTPASSSDYFRTDRDIEGQIIDSETHKPVPGVVVAALWTTPVFRLTIEPGEKYYDYFETLTDRNGKFKIPGKGLNIIRNMPPPKIKIFKAGYFAAYLHDLSPRFIRDSPFTSGIEKIDGKYVIPFFKRSEQKRKKALPEYRQIPFSGMGMANVSPEKYQLYTEELSREYKALGKTPYWEQNPLILRVKEGGVYPAQEKALEPRRGSRVKP